MEKYQVKILNKNFEKFEEKSSIISKDNIESVINNYCEPMHDGTIIKLFSIIPLYDDNEIVENIVVFKEEDIEYHIVKIILDNHEKSPIKLQFTEKQLDVMLKCNKLVYNNKEYSIYDKICEIEDEEYTLSVRCKRLKA